MKCKGVDSRDDLKKIYRKARPFDIQRWQEAIAREEGTAKVKLIAGSLSKSYPFKLDDFEKALVEKDGWIGFADSKY